MWTVRYTLELDKISVFEMRNKSNSFWSRTGSLTWQEVSNLHILHPFKYKQTVMSIYTCSYSCTFKINVKHTCLLYALLTLNMRINIHTYWHLDWHYYPA